MTTKISAKNLCIRIGNKIICENFNIAIKTGEVWGLIGPNGCGKTTLLHTLCGLKPLIEGEIILNSKNLHALNSKSIAKIIAILFQDFDATFPETVFAYCLGSRYPHSGYFQQENTCDIATVHQALDTMGMLHLQTKRISELSGGERQRLAIAGVLAQTPQIYLLDEPTNHLDLHYQIKVLQHFRRLSDCAVLMALHDVNWAQQFCDHVILLFAGGEVLMGAPNVVLTADNLTRLYQHPIEKMNSDRHVFWYPNVATPTLQ